MHVTIEHLGSVKRRGFIWDRMVRGNFVKLLIELSGEEKQTIKQHNLSKYMMLEVPNPAHKDFQKQKANYDPYNTVTWRMTGKLPKSNPYTDPLFRPPETITFTIGTFCNPSGFVRDFATPGEAKNWAQELRDHIKTLKKILDHNSSIPSKTETFDL